MPRKRMIDPSIWIDEGMAELSPRQQLLFIGLFSNADDGGRLKASPSAIRLTLPGIYSRVDDAEVRSDLDAVLSAMTQLRRYQVAGREYLSFANYEKWQRIDRPQASQLPAPDEADSPCFPSKADDSSNDRRTFDESSASVRPSRARPEEKLVEVRSEEEKLEEVKRGEQARTPAPPPVPEELADFDEILRPLRGYHPTPEFFDWVRETCTDVDLRAEAIKMLAHAKKKSYAGDLKFVTSWLERAINPPWEDAAPAPRSRANLVGPASPPAAPRPLPSPKPELPPEEAALNRTWKLALERIQAETRAQDFRAWFKGTRLVQCGDGAAVIEADEPQLPWLEKSRAKIARALEVDQELLAFRAKLVPVGASP